MPNADVGAIQLKRLGLRMKALGASGLNQAATDLGPEFGAGKTLRAQLLAGIRLGAKPAIEEARRVARDTLPKHGGLNEEVATTAITVATRLTGPRVGVRIAVPKGRKKSNKTYGANKGTVRHPVFGKNRWVDQKVPAGWFDSSLQRSAPLIVGPIQAAMKAVSIEATRRL